MLSLAVVGHVEHVTLGTTPSLPGPGEIAHLDEVVSIPGGGGGVTYFQLTKSPARVLLFSAVGGDGTGAEIEARLRASRGEVFLARRDEPHTRDVVMLLPSGERTIVVVGQPLHPRRDDRLPYERLAACDAVYFTAQDPEVLRLCRQARLLMVSARRKQALEASGVTADVVIGSAHDPREASRRADYVKPPGVLVMTEGARGGTVETASGVERFLAPATPKVVRSSYGAGDSFAGAFLYFVAQGVGLKEACERAGAFGAAVLEGLDTIAVQRVVDDDSGGRQ